MLTRRETVLGGLLTIIWDRACAQSRRGRHGQGCMLAPDEAEPFLATASGFQTFRTGKEQFISNTGNRDFDYALAQALSRLTDVMQVLPGFAFYDDYDGENAYATSVRRLNRADGSVLFGKRFFLNRIEGPEHPDAVIAAICAHEYAHILQFKRNLFRTLDAGQRTVKRSELHADYLSGYFAGIRKLERPAYPAAVYATDAYSVGDYDFTSRDHHGTPEERAAAVVRGFEVAFRDRRNLNDAVQIGIKYARTL